MYGPEYLDWRDETRIAGLIDEFLADLGQEDRVWALAVLRKRHTVSAPAQFVPPPASLQNVFNRQGQYPPHHRGSVGSLLGNVLGL